MACVVTVEKVTVEPGGRVLVDWADGTQSEYESLAVLKDAIGKADNDHNACKTWLLAYWLKRNPQGDNKNIVEGKTLTFDLSLAQLMKVQ